MANGGDGIVAALIGLVSAIVGLIGGGGLVRWLANREVVRNDEMHQDHKSRIASIERTYVGEDTVEHAMQEVESRLSRRMERLEQRFDSLQETVHAGFVDILKELKK